LLHLVGDLFEVKKKTYNSFALRLWEEWTI